MASSADFPLPQFHAPLHTPYPLPSLLVKCVLLPFLSPASPFTIPCSLFCLFLRLYSHLLPFVYTLIYVTN